MPLLCFVVVFSTDPRDHIQQDHLDQCVRPGDRSGDYGGGVHREGAERQIQIQTPSADPHRGHYGKRRLVFDHKQMQTALCVNLFYWIKWSQVQCWRVTKYMYQLFRYSYN